MFEHVEALGAVVHGVGGDVGEDDGAGEGEGFAFAGAGDGVVEREAAGFGGEFVGGLIEQGEELVGGEEGAGLFEAGLHGCWARVSFQVRMALMMWVVVAWREPGPMSKGWANFSGERFWQARRIWRVAQRSWVSRMSRGSVGAWTYGAPSYG